MRFLIPFTFALAAVEAAVVEDRVAAADSRLQARGSKPKYGYDPATTRYCSWWYDNEDGSTSCEAMPANWAITEEQWKNWNPSVGASCDGFATQRSYCVEVADEPQLPPTPETPKTTSSDVPTPVATKQSSNTIETPSPIQPGMVGNCDKFYKVRGGDNCDKISSAHGITLNEFLAWNPEVGGTSCAGLWLNAYVCVSTLGHKASPTEPERPDKLSPTQQGLVENCNKFYLVGKGDTCSRIAAKQGIALSDFVQWNPSVGSDCRSLFSQYYVCVGAPGTRKLEPPSTVPSPVQPGISKACSQYYQAVPGDTCQVIADRFKIPEENFYQWNAAVKNDCTGLWAGYYYCVSIPPAFRARAFYHRDCTGSIHNNVAIAADTDGLCIDTSCQAASLDIAAAGLCPDGQVQLSYWEEPGCTGKWFGYGYASRGTCRKLWTEGWMFKSLHLRCAREADDCVRRGSCTYDPAPGANVC